MIEHGDGDPVALASGAMCRVGFRWHLWKCHGGVIFEIGRQALPLAIASTALTMHLLFEPTLVGRIACLATSLRIAAALPRVNRFMDLKEIV